MGIVWCNCLQLRVMQVNFVLVYHSCYSGVKQRDRWFILFGFISGLIVLPLSPLPFRTIVQLFAYESTKHHSSISRAIQPPYSTSFSSWIRFSILKACISWLLDAEDGMSSRQHLLQWLWSVSVKQSSRMIKALIHPPRSAGDLKIDK